MFSGQDSQCSQKRLKSLYTSGQKWQLQTQTDGHKENLSQYRQIFYSNFVMLLGEKTSFSNLF
jgi:hypothetical protein